MTVYYSAYSNPNTGGTLGTSLVDLTSTSFADLVANAATYNSGVEYKKGMIIYDQNSSWIYVNNTPTTGNAPPTLPTISNIYWEILGTNGTFTWIAYANSTNGTTFTDFTTGAYDSGSIVRKWIGISPNKTTSTESTNIADYSWTKIVGENGATGATGERGSKEFFASGSSWSDATANTAISTAGLTKVLLDQVTISNGTDFAETRFWNGSAWTTISQVINGNLLVNGTVGANALVAGTVLANVFNVGNTKFKLDGAAQGAGKGSLIVTNGTNNILTLGYIDASNIGLSLKDASGNIVMQTSAPAGGGAATSLYAAAISNSNITINGSGQIQNIGSGAGTAVANSLVPLGNNLCINSDFINSTTGWQAGWDGTIGGTIGRGINLTGSPNNWFGQLNVLYATRGGVPTANTVFDAFVNATTGAGVEGLKQYSIPVIPGDRVYFSWLVGPHRCSAYAVIGWYDGSGNYIAENGGNMVASNGGASNGNPDTMVRSGEFATAPANARYARTWVRGVATGETDPYIFCTQPFISKVSSLQTIAPAYTSGPPDRAATKGATIGTDLVGTFTESEFNNRFNTNIINGTYLKDATIGSAKIGNAAITNAKIGNLEVDTIKIANNAVTVPVSAYTASSTSWSANTWTDLQSVSITTSGGIISLKAGINLSQYSSVVNTAVDTYIRILRGATDITGSIKIPQTGVGVGLGDTIFIISYLGTISFSDSPSSGSHTYKFQIYSSEPSPNAASQYTGENRYLEAIELKK